MRQGSLAISGVNGNGVVNVASVVHRSPFRYPGGKTWLVPTIRQWLRQCDPRPRELAEPFAGGGIVALSSLFDNLVSKIVLVEQDEDVAAVWKTIVYGDGTRLASEILCFDLNIESVRSLLAQVPRNEFERAFATIVRNRVQRGDVLAPGASLTNGAENRKALRSCRRRNGPRRRIDAIGGRALEPSQRRN